MPCKGFPYKLLSASCLYAGPCTQTKTKNDYERNAVPINLSISGKSDTSTFFRGSSLFGSSWTGTRSVAGQLTSKSVDFTTESQPDTLTH